jgi:hypothetical protein
MGLGAWKSGLRGVSLLGPTCQILLRMAVSSRTSDIACFVCSRGTNKLQLESACVIPGRPVACCPRFDLRSAARTVSFRGLVVEG